MLSKGAFSAFKGIPAFSQPPARRSQERDSNPPIKIFKREKLTHSQNTNIHQPSLAGPLLACSSIKDTLDSDTFIPPPHPTRLQCSSLAPLNLQVTKRGGKKYPAASPPLFLPPPFPQSTSPKPNPPAPAADSRTKGGCRRRGWGRDQISRNSISSQPSSPMLPPSPPPTGYSS